MRAVCQIQIAAYQPSPDNSGNPFVPVARLREAQKIGTDSGKKLQKKQYQTQKDTTKNYEKHHRNSQNQIKNPKTAAKNTQPL